MIILKKIPFITKKGTLEVPVAPQDLYFLKGWKWNTLVGFNTAIKKFTRFMASTGRPSFTLPISESNVFDFCYWAGRDDGRTTEQEIASSTLGKYIHGIKFWHLYHKEKYPKDADERVKALLKSSARADVSAPPKTKKGAIHLKHLLFLADKLLQGGKKEAAILDLAITAFWGMARLAELTYQFSTGNLEYSISLLTSDVRFKIPGLSNRASKQSSDDLQKRAEPTPRSLATSTIEEIESTSRKTQSPGPCRKFGLKVISDPSRDIPFELEALPFETLSALISKKSAA
ncbi:hypothetical protein PSTG_01392 [Puccinia striiformis f. sp. tritici PST-78]|uniref:Core-binding (CB) domain-containing protein n=1 Tax=Puccinia striiformis f. sp. tritici PST-78 TaxID=1165861 RepID=A0A0L0W215_9BASI|nr:hypothetical protein PSTG_01392 [Puccinia striiformis f. sp. tritici PST-78]